MPWTLLALGTAGAALVDLRFATDTFDGSNGARVSGDLLAVTTGAGAVVSTVAASVLAVAARDGGDHPPAAVSAPPRRALSTRRGHRTLRAEVRRPPSAGNGTPWPTPTAPIPSPRT